MPGDRPEGPLRAALLASAEAHEAGRLDALTLAGPDDLGPPGFTASRVALGFLEQWVREASLGFPAQGVIARGDWPILARQVAADLAAGRPVVEPRVIHAWVAGYNWGEGFGAMWPLVDDPRTQRATALLMYWRVEGPYFRDGTAQATRFHDTLERRLIDGHYERADLRYDPVADNELAGSALYRLRKAGVPEVLFSSVGGALPSAAREQEPG